MKLITGVNDIETLYPDLIKDWNYERNGSLIPSQFTKGSDTYIWWKCHECGHEWPAKISHRTSGSRCPCCSGRVLIVGVNDLASQRPSLLADWDYSKNRKLPNEVFVFSHERAHWHCHACHYEWDTEIQNRSKGTECPRCKNKVLIPGVNDLASQRPELVKEWDNERNEKQPNEVFVFSKKPAYWICSAHGHKWEAPIENRSNGVNCPVCGGRKANTKRKVV